MGVRHGAFRRSVNVGVTLVDSPLAVSSSADDAVWNASARQEVGPVRSYPFSAVVGLDDIALALVLSAVSPGFAATPVAEAGG